MKMKKLMSLSLASLLAASAAWAAGDQAAAPSNQASATQATVMTEGEVRKVDLENKKITLKHGEIKNLDMPGMTMVFQVKDTAKLSTLGPGDKMRFHAERAGGAIVITDIEAAK